MKRFQKPKLILALVVVAMLFGVVATLAMKVPAKADTITYSSLGYPWPTAPCAWNGNTTGSCSGYDWGLKTCPSGDSYCTSANQINGYYLYDKWGYGFRNCTSFVAWKLNTLGVDPKYFKGLGNGGDWYTNAKNKGLVSVGTTPRVGAAAVVPNNNHVAYVSAINSDGTITVQEYNHDEKGNGDTWTGPPSARGFTEYVYFASKMSGLPAYAGKIVQWYNGPNTPNTSWLVSWDLTRYWIPDSSTYNCLTSQGFANVGVVSSNLLSQLPNQPGKWAECGKNSLGVNQFLFRGSYLKSSNGLYTLELQGSDGNLVLYGPNGALWANSKSSDFLVLQGDNNLVTYGYGVGATWASNTLSTGANTLMVTNNGSLALYTSAGVHIWPKPGDCNFDGHVNSIDLSILLSHYGQAYGPCDFNNDGIVNVVDLSILQSNYGKY